MFDLRYPFSNSADLFQSKVMCENLVWIGWNRRYVDFHGGGGQKPTIKRGYLRPAMLIFVHSRAFPVKSHVIIIITSRTREKFHGSCSGISLRCSVLSLIKENLRCS